jgi:hypothetical protein
MAVHVAEHHGTAVVIRENRGVQKVEPGLAGERAAESHKDQYCERHSGFQ